MENAVRKTDFEHQQPWNLWFRQAQSGDKDAIHNIITASQPFIRSISMDPLFRKRMSQDEIISNANYALIKYIKTHKNLPCDSEVPYFLRCVLRRDLKDCIRHMNIQEQYEQLAKPAKSKIAPDDEEYTANECDKAVSTDTTTEPEAHILNNELCNEVREAIRQLPKDEKTVIHGFYYQHKGMKEIAGDLHCSFQNAYKTRNRAYSHLHKILKKTVYA
ncbi:MAG: sigma-70 family RNA polymerase sigma factor [Acidaminococcaceae bacterium]|nr:sigma-70 family RNA polymerase sigma factor [Acidaminococcaceae bacterium]